MAKSDNENLINIQSITPFQQESNPPPISPTNNIDSHEKFIFKIDENSTFKPPSIDVDSNANPSSSSLDSEIIVTDLKNKIIGAQNHVEDLKLKEENCKLKENNPISQVVNAEKSDNAVLRKLLRVSRYFDPADNDWGNCYNCRGTGHTVANCTAARRKKPCYVCGSLQHIPKHCKKGRVCTNCKQSGHRAKSCPEKSAEGIQKAKSCLKCGDSGHDMFTCTTAYPPDDLNEIQCYICKRFGHLCCLDYGRVLGVVSCYVCGQLGHTGSECTLSSSQKHEYTTNTTSPNLCKKCSEEGHTTCKCKTSVKRKRRSRRHRLKEKKDDLESDKSGKRVKPENGFSNSSQPKHRGSRRWINGSPSTSVTYRPKNSFHEFHYPSSSFQHEASSRFGNCSQEYSRDY